jgi:hypothetical protein
MKRSALSRASQRFFICKPDTLFDEDYDGHDSLAEGEQQSQVVIRG